MSAQGPPTPDDLVEELGITPDEAQGIADAMRPLQDITGVGSSVGGALEGAPGAGPKLIGTALQNLSNQVNLASTSAETLARALEFYLEAQTESAEALFPPPGEVADRVTSDAMPLVEGLADVSDGG